MIRANQASLLSDAEECFLVRHTATFNAPPETSIFALRDREGTGHAATGILSADRGTSGGAPVDRRSSRREVDNDPAARKTVGALSKRNIADQCDESSIEVVNSDVARSGVAGFADGDAARCVDPVNLDSATASIGHRHARGIERHTGLLNANRTRQDDTVRSILHFDPPGIERHRRIAVVASENLRGRRACEQQK